MPRRTLSIFLVLLAAIGATATSLVTATEMAAAATPITIYVKAGAPTSCPARGAAKPTVGKIQVAIRCALAGDTVRVPAGTFRERITINKNISVIGAGKTATIIDGSRGGAVVTVPAGAVVKLTDLTATNGTEGIVVKGNLLSGRIVSRDHTRNGMLLDTGAKVQIGPDFDIHHNALDGVRIKRLSGVEAVFSGERPTLRSTSMIHDNGGNGVTVGLPFTTELAPKINVRLGDLDIFSNQGDGIFVRDDAGAARTRIALLDNDVYTNGKSGLFSGRAVVGQAIDTDGLPTFAQNKFHNNALNQIVFDGGGDAFPSYTFEINSPTDACDAGASAIYCYTAKNVFGIFAQGNSQVNVRHTQFEGGGTGLKDFSAQSGSQISVSQNCTALTICP